MRILLFLLLLAAGAAHRPARTMAVEQRQAPLAGVAQGAAFRGRLVGAREQPAPTLEFDAEGQKHEVAAENLVHWGQFVEPARGIHVVLAGGGIVVAESAEINEERLRGTTALFGNLDLPLTLVAGILFHPPLDRARLDQLVTRIASARGAEDRLLLDNGDELTGTIAPSSARAIALQTDASKVEMDLEQVAAVIFNPVLLERLQAPRLQIIVGFSDGSRLSASGLTGADGSALLKISAGVELRAAIDSIVALQTLGGRAVYLSDLKPLSYRHIPFLQLSWPLKSDRSVLGRMLRAGGGLYLKGLGMHSPARVTYDVDGLFRRFEADMAVDAECGDRGSVVFRVFLDDGAGEWREAAASKTVRGGDQPMPISVDLAGAKRISLLVDFADHADEQDHADWLNARLIR